MKFVARAILSKVSVDDHDEDSKPTGLNRLVIHPKRRWKGAFDIFIVICVIYSSVVAPVKVTYNVEFLTGLDAFLDVVFVLDILVQCFSGYYDLGGTRFPVLRFDRVLERYAETWMPIDVIAGIPFDRFIPSLNWMQLLKTVRLIKVRRILRKWNNLSIAPLIKVFTIIAFWLLCAHWLSCGFFGVGWATCGTYAEKYPEFVGGAVCMIGNQPCNGNWITTYWPTMKGPCEAGEDPIVGANASGIPISTIHIRCFAWCLATMSSMGYGDAPKAISDVDYVYGFFTQVIGACLAAAIFSNIGRLINSGDAAGERYQMQLDKINEFCRLYELDAESKTQLTEYHELLFSAFRGFDAQAVAKSFPRQLQVSTFYKMHAELIGSVPEFNGAELEMLKVLSLHLNPQVLLKGDFAFHKNEIGEAMFFIKFGQVDIGNEDVSVVYTTKQPGTYFGEIAVFSEERRTASARAKRDCMLYSLAKTAVDATKKHYPESYKLIHDQAVAERTRVSSINAVEDQKSPSTRSPDKLSNRSQTSPSLCGGSSPAHISGTKDRPAGGTAGDGTARV